MSTFSAIYLEFLDELEAISTDCHELTDTEVRERIASVLDFYFVWNHPVQTGIPKRYAMSSPQGDQKVREAVSRFLTAALSSAEIRMLPSSSARHAALHDPVLLTKHGHGFDWYIGSWEESTNCPPKPRSDRNYRYSSRAPDLYGSFIGEGTMRMDVGGRMARVAFDSDVQQYLCWIPGEVEAQYFNARSKKEVLLKATQILRACLAANSP
jgi:hypothetical protein